MPRVKWEVTMDGWIEGKMHKLVYGSLNGCMDGSINIWMIDVSVNDE